MNGVSLSRVNFKSPFCVPFRNLFFAKHREQSENRPSKIDRSGTSGVHACMQANTGNFKSQRKTSNLQ